ncbi:phosphoglyceromutase [Aquimarina rhabdastrellae]
MENKLIFIFLDGIGLGKNESFNPFTLANMPTMFNLIGEKLTNTTNIVKQDFLIKGIDACLEVEGIPQSATGQTSLFTGCNAQAFLGYHLMAYPNDQLISMINKRSIFKYANENGIKNVFANSYTDGFFKSFDIASTNYSVTTRCVLAAKNSLNTLNDLKEGKAVHWDITNFTLQDESDNKIPLITPFKAGENLRNLTKKYDLVVYECFMPDMIGHSKDMNKALIFLEMLDDFFKGVIHNKQENIHVLITSDHGNIEDLSFGGHSTNQVPLIFMGKEAQHFVKVRAIDEIFDIVFSKLFNVVPVPKFEKI